MNPPSALHGAMGRDRKPFTYTPGGLDLSEIKSERMAARLMRNAMNQGVPELPPQHHIQSPPTPSTPIAVPNFNCLPVQVFPTFNLPANPKSLLRTRSNPSQPRELPAPRPAPPATPQFVNNFRLSGETQYEPTKKNAPYSQLNNNRPVSMYEFGTPANTMNYGSNGYTANTPDNNNYNNEYLKNTKLNINEVFKSVAPPVDMITSSNSENNWKDTSNVASENTFQPIETTNKSPELVEDYIQTQQINKEIGTPIDINIDKPIEKIMEAFERIDSILGKTELKSEQKNNEAVVDVDVDKISSNTANNPQFITENQSTEDVMGLSKEKKEVKVVQKHLIKKDIDTEEQNGSSEQNGGTEVQAVIKLPSKKSAAKTETKVEVHKKTLPDGSTEEVKKTITKTTVDGRTEIRTKTETTIIPKEGDDEEIDEEGEESSETEAVTEEKETAVKKSLEEEQPKENGQESNIIKTEEKSETTTTTSKKVTVVQDDQDDSQEEEEVVEEEETEEAEPVTVTSKNFEEKQESKETLSVQESQKEAEEEEEEVEIEEVKESEKTVEIEEVKEKPAKVEEAKEVNEPENAEKTPQTEKEDEEETESDETQVEEEHTTEEKEPQAEKIESQSENIQSQSEDVEHKETEEEEVEEEEEYEEAEQETVEKVTENTKIPEESKDDESSKEVEDLVESKEEDQKVSTEKAQTENSSKKEQKEEEIDENDYKLEQSQQVDEEKQEIIIEKEEMKSEKQEVPEEKLEPKVIKIEVQEQKVPLREPSVPLEKVEDVEIKPIGAGDFITKTHTENTEIITNVTDNPTGLLTEYNRVENIVTVNRTIKTLDHQEVPPMKTYFSPHDRIASSSQASPYQPAYTQQPTERRHSLLLERLSVERQMPAEIYQNNYQQTTQNIEQQRQWSQEPQAEVLTVSNVKPSQITNQQWYQPRESTVINSSTPSQPAAPSWTQPKAQSQPIYQPQAQYRVSTPQPQYRAPTPQQQPQPERQPSYMENVQENSYQTTYSYTPKPRSASSTRAVSPIPAITTPTPQNQYNYVNKDSSESYLKSTQNYTSSSYVPPPWEQDTSYVPPEIQQNVYQPPQVNAYTTAPAQSWKPPANKFSKPKPSAYIPPKPNQSFVANVTSVEPPKLPGRKTYYSEYERRYITVPESTYIPGETKFQPQPDPSPKYYYDNNEPAETVEPEWRKELREFTEKSQTRTETNVKPPWEQNQKAPEQQTPTWSQTVRPQSWRERSFESEFVSQEWPKANTLGRGRPLTSYSKETVSERTRGVSVDRYNPHNYQAPLAAEHPPVPTHTHIPPTPLASGYHNPNVPAYHARASAEPREHVSHPVPRPKEARASPFQSRSFKYLQWITGTED